jgi:hypothetical protein
MPVVSGLNVVIFSRYKIYRVPRNPVLAVLDYLFSPPPFEINLGKPNWFSQKGEWLNMARHFKQPERTH